MIPTLSFLKSKFVFHFLYLFSKQIFHYHSVLLTFLFPDFYANCTIGVHCKILASLINHASKFSLFVCVCACVRVRVRVRACVCVIISFHRKRFSWLNKTNVMPEIRPAMLCWGNDSVSSTFVTTSQTIIAWTLKLATLQECQVRTSKRQLLKRSKNQR